MLDTTVTIVGNAITMPEWRRLERTGALVAHFKVASHPRRFDKATEKWVDLEGVRVRVSCWRRLAEGVASSVKVGDPVIVTGRLFCRDWTTDDGQRRVTYELEAGSVGHDLARGRAVFERTRGLTSTSTVEDAQTDSYVRGERSEVVASDHDPQEVPEALDAAGPYGLVPPGVPDADDPDPDESGDDDGSADAGIAGAFATLDGELAELTTPVGAESGAGTVVRRRRGRAPAEV